MRQTDPNRAFRVLLVEDDETDFVIFKGILSRIKEGTFNLAWASSYQAGLQLLIEQQPDIVLVDYRLGIGSNAPTGLDFIKEASQAAHKAPIVVLTGTGSHAIDVQAMQLGAVDYIPKHELSSDLLERAIRYALDRFRAHTDLQSALLQVENSRRDLLSILGRLRLGTAMTDVEDKITFLSDVGQRLLDIDDKSVLGKPWEVLFEGQSVAIAAIRSAIETGDGSKPKIPVSRDATKGRRYDVEVEVVSDPFDPSRKIFFFYDMSEIHTLRRTIGPAVQFQGMIGISDKMQAAFQQIRNVADLDSTVLIEGKTGTGKELAARAIHFTGCRKDGPFIPVNCAGLSESLVASQLFGHRRGAFTGAVENSQGLFEAAQNGTLFLDEIGDVPSSVQTTLLRVLQDKKVARVGETRQRDVDVRFVAASQHDLSKEVEAGRFRADLLYRIRVARVTLPPLSERTEDIPLLMEQFLDQCRTATGKSVNGFSDEAKQTLMAYSWPGNVRELRSAVESAVINSQDDTIKIEDLPPEIRNGFESNEESVKPISAMTPDDERTRILVALEKAGGNRSRAAKLLGISRATIYRRISLLELDREVEPELE